jgi:hypothetical protein
METWRLIRIVWDQFVLQAIGQRFASHLPFCAVRMLELSTDSDRINTYFN